MVVKLARDGIVEEVSLKGGLSIQVNNPDAACCRIHLEPANSKQFQMQLHPTIARSFLTDSVIMMKDPKRGFPVDSSMTVVRWRLVNGGEDYLPLNVTCWPEAIDNGFDVNVEYTLNPAVLSAIQNVRICIPLPSGASPEVVAVDGSYHFVCFYDFYLILQYPKESFLEWEIGDVSEEQSTGVLEFKIKGESEDDFFPTSVEFESTKTFVDTNVIVVFFHFI